MGDLLKWAAWGLLVVVGGPFLLGVLVTLPLTWLWRSSARAEKLACPVDPEQRLRQTTAECWPSLPPERRLDYARSVALVAGLRPDQLQKPDPLAQHVPAEVYRPSPAGWVPER